MKEISPNIYGTFSRSVIFSFFILSQNKPTEISWTFNDPTLSWIPSIPRQGWWLKQRAGLGLVDSPRPPIRRDLAGNPRPCDPPQRQGWVRFRRGFARPCRRQILRDREFRRTPTTTPVVSTVTTTRWKRRANIFLSYIYRVFGFVGKIASGLLASIE